MDVKSAFLNGMVKDEVYVKQPKGFDYSHFPNHVIWLRKYLYILKQASLVWYKCLATFLLNNGFPKGRGDTIPFVHRNKREVVVAQIYVDDIIFESMKDVLAQKFTLTMQNEFKMSSVRELKFFLRFQVKQLKDEIFLFQVNYAKELFKKFGLDKTKSSHTPISTLVKLYQDPSGKEVK